MKGEVACDSVSDCYEQKPARWPILVKGGNEPAAGAIVAPMNIDG